MSFAPDIAEFQTLQQENHALTERIEKADARIADLEASVELAAQAGARWAGDATRYFHRVAELETAVWNFLWRDGDEPFALRLLVPRSSRSADSVSPLQNVGVRPVDGPASMQPVEGATPSCPTNDTRASDAPAERVRLMPEGKCFFASEGWDWGDTAEVVRRWESKLVSEPGKTVSMVELRKPGANNLKIGACYARPFAPETRTNEASAISRAQAFYEKIGSEECDTCGWSPNEIRDIVADRAELKTALAKIRTWDMLNPAPGTSEPLADGPWVRAVIDKALAACSSTPGQRVDKASVTPKVSPTKTSASAYRKQHAEMCRRALEYLNTEGREEETGADQIGAVAHMLEKAWDEGFETALALPGADSDYPRAERQLLEAVRLAAEACRPLRAFDHAERVVKHAALWSALDDLDMWRREHGQDSANPSSGEKK